MGAWIAARPRTVVAMFAVLLAISAFYGASVRERLTAGGNDVPGSESDRVTEVSERRLAIGRPDVVLLYRRSDGGDMRSSTAAAAVTDAVFGLLAEDGVLGATSYYDAHLDSLVSRDGREALVLLSLEGDAARKVSVFRRLEPSLRDPGPDLSVEIGGLVALSTLAQEVAAADLKRAEALALPIAALLTLVFFRSAVAALLPVLIGGLAVASAAALVGVASHFFAVAIFALNVCAFLGLGLSIDYALLLVQRFREELAAGRAVPDAVAVTMDTAGAPSGSPASPSA
jgi:RND superfamily putative drug exporter